MVLYSDASDPSPGIQSSIFHQHRHICTIFYKKLPRFFFTNGLKIKYKRHPLFVMLRLEQGSTQKDIGMKQNI